MGDTKTAPKRWCLSEHETLNTFERWRQHQIWCLSQEKTFAPFLKDGVTWLKKSSANETRGLTDDAAGANAVTADQKVILLESLLNQICNFCPVVSRSTLLKQSTSLASVWNMIRLHFGFHQTGAQFLCFADITLEHDERAETLYQRLLAFIEDSLLTKNSVIKHHDETVNADEELTPTLENVVVLRWLQLINAELPKLVKQKYATELRTRTLSSLKPEISMALDSLLDEIKSCNDVKVMRSTLYQSGSSKRYSGNGSSKPNISCPLCKAEGRPHSHFLSKCTYLPPGDKKFLSKARSLTLGDQEDDTIEEEEPETSSVRKIDVRRVSVVQSPVLVVSYKDISLVIVIDSGATGNFIHIDVVRRLGLPIAKTMHKANQADGLAKMDVIGEITAMFEKDNHKLYFDGLVVTQLDADIIGGSPFQEKNDVFPRVAKKCVQIGNDQYPYTQQSVDRLSNRRIQAHVVGLKSTTTVWPAEELQIPVPDYLKLDAEVAVEPRLDECKFPLIPYLWPSPGIVTVSNGMISVKNTSKVPIVIKKSKQFCQIRAVDVYNEPPGIVNDSTSISKVPSTQKSVFSSAVQIDPDNLMCPKYRQMFQGQLLEYDTVFDPNIPGYNGSFGAIYARVNMGPVQPPQRKGRLPQYNRKNLVEQQSKFDELEALGVFKKPEDVDIPVEYLNPSFLVKKSRGDGHRLVTAFADIGRYSKPQPVLMPDINSTLRTIANWKHIITTDLTKAYFQVPLDRSSIKYCGVATPFKGVRVYVRSAMGMPGSEVALEELMCRVLGDLLEEGVVCKLADNLFVGGQNLEQLFDNWGRVLNALSKADLKLSSIQTIVNPKTTSILGWTWSLGTITASVHQVNTLSICSRPETVKQLRAYIGAYKFLSRVIPQCAKYLAPLDDMTAGKSSCDRLSWSETEEHAFKVSQDALSTNKTITLPKPTDQLWVVTDGACRKPGIAATMYIARGKEFLVAGYFSAKLRKNQLDWLPCEIEGLGISSALKFFSVYIIQSHHKVCLLTDSKPCCQAFEKLCRGEFSCSPRVSTFLSTVSQYQASVRHTAGVNNVLTDFGSRNPVDCSDESCKICSFISESEECVVRNISVEDVINGNSKLPFTSRSAWAAIQLECPDLRRVCSHLRQGTRPSKKLTNIKDVKRYLNNVIISRDGLLVVQSKNPYSVKERIVIPRSVLLGILTALHIKLNCPKKHQMKLICDRYFFALDIEKAIGSVCKSCHKCASLQQLPSTIVPQTTSDPPEVVGSLFAADVIKRERQCILVTREYVTSYTSTRIIDNEQAVSLKEGLVLLCTGLCPLDGPHAVVRVDPAPGFQALEGDKTLESCRLSLEIGRHKNINKNPVAERAVQEIEEELLKLDPRGNSVSSITLAMATLNLNSKIRSRGLSSREMLLQRDQFSNKQIPISDEILINEQHNNRLQNHGYSEKSKNPSMVPPVHSDAQVGDLIYVSSDLSKSKSRDRYIVASEDGSWLNVRKFVGSQLRKNTYRVKRNEVFKIPYAPDVTLKVHLDTEEIEEELDIHPEEMIQEAPPELPDIPEIYQSHPADNPYIEPLPSDSATHIDSHLDDSDHNANGSESDAVKSRPKRERNPPSFLQVNYNSKSYTNM